MILFFDTETTGLVDFKASPTSVNQPHLVQLGCILSANNGEEISRLSLTVKPEGYEIPDNMVHGITNAAALKGGVRLVNVINLFANLCDIADLIVCHNYKFDSIVMQAECHRIGVRDPFLTKKTFCTMLESTSVCCIPAKWNKGYKWPKLEEAYEFFFNTSMEGAHNALCDVEATKKIFFALLHKNTIVEKDGAGTPSHITQSNKPYPSVNVGVIDNPSHIITPMH